MIAAMHPVNCIPALYFILQKNLKNSKKNSKKGVALLQNP